MKEIKVKTRMIAIVHYPQGNFEDKPGRTNKAHAYEAVKTGLRDGVIMLPADRDHQGHRLWDVDLTFYTEEV